MEVKANLIGKAGELRVRSELILKGFLPAVFDQDTGADIILSNGKRLQVKTSLKPVHNKKAYSWMYAFSIKQAQFRSAGNGEYKRKLTRKDYSEQVDYFIFWLVEANTFYIIPEEIIGARVSFVIPTPEEKRTYKKLTWKESSSKYEKYKNNWELLK
jgi:hypothetical protein